MVSWLQTLLYWWDNNIVFIVDVSRVYANSSLEGRQETVWKRSLHTHWISENFL